MRLGVAVDAIRAAQRFFSSEDTAPGLAGERDRLWAFLLAMGFRHEALQIPGRQFARMEQLAERGGATDELQDRFRVLKSGRDGFSRQVANARNRVMFRWDENPFREWVTAYSDETIEWQEGTSESQNDSIHRAADDALAAGILSGASAQRFLQRFIADLLTATAVTMAMFEHGIAGHLLNQAVPLRGH